MIAKLENITFKKKIWKIATFNLYTYFVNEGHWLKFDKWQASLVSQFDFIDTSK